MIQKILDARSTLYYNRYLYSVHAYLKDAYSLRYPVDKIEMMLIWKYQRHNLFGDGHVPHLPDLKNFKQFVQEQQDIKMVLFSNFVYLYTNDATIPQKLQDLPYVKNVFLHQADLVLPHDILIRENPQWKYRSYFRERYLGEERGNILSRFLLNRKDCFGYSNTLNSRMQDESGLRRCQSHYFVEHNDLRDLTMLDLVCPGIIRKTLPIQAK